MSHASEFDTPSEPELELASDLAHCISSQAQGTRDSERLWIYAAARQIERLLSGSATQIDFARARTHLELVDLADERAAQPSQAARRGAAPRKTPEGSGCESRQRRAA
ncbi:MAG: hypothetical protein ABSD82_11495 [Solirubrobacteraceae bacterium]|jgi:hypothetical protein